MSQALQNYDLTHWCVEYFRNYLKGGQTYIYQKDTPSSTWDLLQKFNDTVWCDDDEYETVYHSGEDSDWIELVSTDFNCDSDSEADDDEDDNESFIISDSETVAEPEWEDEEWENESCDSSDSEEEEIMLERSDE